MGCNASVSNETIDELTDIQIQQIRDGCISPLSYQIFLNNFYFVSTYNKFYTNLPLDKQLKVLEDIGPLTKNECITVVSNFCKYANSEETLEPTLMQVSRKLVCKTKVEGRDEDVYIPVGFNEKLWKSIMYRKYETPFGKYRINKEAVDWNNEEITTSRDIFLGDFQNTISSVNHNKDLSLLISSNPIHNLWLKQTYQPVPIQTANEENNNDIENNKDDNNEKENNENDENNENKNNNDENKNNNDENENNKNENKKTKKVSKPFSWEPSIHEAAFKGKKSSVQYNIYLIPQLIDLPDDKDNTPVHYAALGNQKAMLSYLHEIGANFHQPNSEGYLPVHLISNKNVVTAMNQLGVSISDRNADGESLLDIKTREFDKQMIKTMIGLGVNIFEPNPDGSYWIQKTLHNEYFGTVMNESKFISFVRKLLISNKTGPWNDNPIYQEIIQRKEKTHTQEDIDDLNQCVLDQNIDRLKVLLAIGTRADNKLPTGETNLYLCAKRGLSESAKILSENFCDTNYTNSQHENTFWVAAINRRYETALVLRDHGADMNMYDVNKETIMHNVYRRKIKDIFEFLLEAGASPNIKNGNFHTVTYIAFFTRDDQVAEMIQDKYNGDINAQDQQMYSLAHHALAQNDLSRIEYLSSRNINMDLKNNNGHSVFLMAYFTAINFQTLQFLIDKGANVSSFDFQGNTLLHHLFMMKKPREDVYKFLIDNHIDINIENQSLQFPISIAIEMGHDKFGFDLLNMNCRILDKNSIHEPIVEALKRKNQKWVEELFKHGADGMNEKAGVISRYINSGFFNYELFKNIPRMNIILEAPLQMAIYKKYQDCAVDIWNMAGSEMNKVLLAGNKDCYGRVLISAAIMMNNEPFVETLLSKKYDINTPDNDGKTPFIHACSVNNINWMTQMFKMIPLSNANKVDKYKNSALTYAAINNQKDFCDMMFLADIDVDDINSDQNGIISHYKKLMKRYREAKEQAEDNYESAQKEYDFERRCYNDAVDELNDVRQKIDRLNSDIESYNRSDTKGFFSSVSIDIRKSSLESKLSQAVSYVNSCERSMENRKVEMRYYKAKYDEMCKVTRRDILYNIDGVERIAEKNF